MLGVAALASRPRPPSVQEEATLFRELRTPRVFPRDARPGMILRAAPQVMSLQREHDSNSDNIVSHPNATLRSKPIPTITPIPRMVRRRVVSAALWNWPPYST